jgi:hypothetical protein
MAPAGPGLSTFAPWGRLARTERNVSGTRVKGVLWQDWPCGQNLGRKPEGRQRASTREAMSLGEQSSTCRASTVLSGRASKPKARSPTATASPYLPAPSASAGQDVDHREEGDDDHDSDGDDGDGGRG